MATKEDNARACRNCGRMQPESLLNKEGRCQTCGPSAGGERARDPSESGPYGEPKRRTAKETDGDGGDAGATDGEGTNAEDQG